MISIRVINPLFRGGVGANSKLNMVTKQLLQACRPLGAEGDGQWERSFFPQGPGLSWDGGVGCHEAERPQSPLLLTPLEMWKFSPRLMSDTCSLENQTWGKDCVGSVSPPLAPGSWYRCAWSCGSSEGNSHGMSHSRTHVSRKSDKILHLKLHDSNGLQKSSPCAAYRALIDNKKHCP